MFGIGLLCLILIGVYTCCLFAGADTKNWFMRLIALVSGVSQLILAVWAVTNGPS